MSLISQAAPPEDDPVIGTFMGEPGTGKTTLAATFPKPVFMQCEKGLKSIPREQRPDAMPLIKTLDDMREQLKSVLRDEHDYKTLVIDTVTELNGMFDDHVLNTNPDKHGKKPTNLTQACGGFRGGQQAVGNMHNSLRKACESIREQRDMNIIFLAHCGIQNVPSPDQDTYIRWNLALDKESLHSYIDNVDIVGFLHHEVFIKGDANNHNAKKKAIGGGNVILSCQTNPAFVCSNRYGITEDIYVKQGVNPLGDFIPTLKEST